MPLLRTYDAARREVGTSLHSAYLDRLSRWSDIREYLPLLYDFARSYPQVRVLELGSRKGNSTLAFLAGAEESGGHVWSCDIDDVTAVPDGMTLGRAASRGRSSAATTCTPPSARSCPPKRTSCSSTPPTSTGTR